MASVSTDINRMIKSLSKLGGMVEKCGPDMVLAIKAELQRTINAGTDPYGDKWQLTKPDEARGRSGGEVPLRNAMSAVTVTAMAKTIYIVVRGPEAMHHLGSANGKIKRRVIPSKKRIPDGMMLAIKHVLDRYFENEVKHGA